MVTDYLQRILTIIAQKGINDLKAQNLTPDRTQRSLSKDAALAKEKVS